MESGFDPYGGSKRKYARFGRKVAKAGSQAKICTPPGGEVIAKICIAASRIRVRPVGRPSFFVRGNMKPEPGAIPYGYAAALHRSFDDLSNHSACDLSDCEFLVYLEELSP